MAHTAETDAAFLQRLKDCDFMNDEKLDLITGRFTNTKINERVRERHLGCCEGYGYFNNFFSSEVWGDGQGQDEIREMYFHPSIAYSFNYFTRTMEICDPKLANECHTDYCDIPEGGYGNLPPIEMYKWGFKTPRSCIANIRHIRQFREWAKRTIDTRFVIDQQVMQMFYTFAAIRMTGHKLVLEAIDDGNGGLIPYPSDDPRNPMQAWKYNFMEPLFPAVDDPNKIVPLQLDTLQQLARRWTHHCNNSNVAVGPRGEKIWEFWYPEDWYEEEVLRDPEYLERLKYTMPSKLFAGYSLDPRGAREVVGNWAMRPMPCLPRFAESCDGGLVPIDMHEDIKVEIGHESVESRQWLNAPFLMAGTFSPNMGTILTRPALTTSAEGWAISPIMGNGDWKVRNDYDKECNPDLNMPYAQKRYEMGMRLDDPYGSLAFIFRARKYRTTAINACELMPNFKVVPTNPCDNLMTVGCEDNKRKVGSSVTTTDDNVYVKCSAPWCGPAIAGETVYRLDVERKGLREAFSPLDCKCGAKVVVSIHDNKGAVIRQEQAIIQEVMTPPDAVVYKLWVRLPTLAAGECIKGVTCVDSTPLVGAVTACWVSDPADDCATFAGMKISVDSPVLNAAGKVAKVGDTLEVDYLNSSGASVGKRDATVAEYDHGTYVYRLTSATSGFDCDGGFTGVDSLQVTLKTSV